MRFINPIWAWFLIPICALLLAVILPVLSRINEISQRVICANKLNDISIALIVYANDNDGNSPSPNKWCDLLIQEADLPQKDFLCPLDEKDSCSYAINENLYKLEETAVVPAEMVALFEADLGINGAGGADDVILRHNQHGQLGCNIAFADGTVEFIAENRIENLKWVIEEE
jgi:prepilin-type processing-associated H-X9-DG protein